MVDVLMVNSNIAVYGECFLNISLWRVGEVLVLISYLPFGLIGKLRLADYL